MSDPVIQPSPWPERPGERMRLQDAEARRVPFVHYRDGDGDLQVASWRPPTAAW